VIRIDARTAPLAEVVSLAAKIAEEGGTIIFPTETVYGIGALPNKLAAIARIYALKGRPETKPLTLHCATIADARLYLDDHRLGTLAARTFLPGPLTVIVPRPPMVDPAGTAQLPTLGIRVPADPLARAILAACGPLAATSANLSGEDPFSGEGSAALPAADLFIDAGPTRFGAPSSVLDVTTSPPHLIREGVLSRTMLEKVLGPIAVLVAALFLALAGPVLAQSELRNFGDFDYVKLSSFDMNEKTGAVSIPNRFTGMRSGTEVSGDRMTGNRKSKQYTVDGNVVIHRETPLLERGEVTRLTKGPSTLTCDKLQIDGNLKTYTVIGHVHYVEGQRDITADRGSLNDVTNKLHVEGNVNARDGETTMQNVEFLDYDTKIGAMHGEGKPITVRAPTETSAPHAAASAPHAEASAPPR
jgi:tRNA threonylcarbamoyl adenosine modification protein (Sua5/YciO/YrdC/YwlC family)